MPTRKTSYLTLTLFLIFCAGVFIDNGQAQKSGAVFSPIIPKTFDDAEMPSLKDASAATRHRSIPATN